MRRELDRLVEAGLWIDEELRAVHQLTTTFKHAPERAQDENAEQPRRRRQCASAKAFGILPV
jgi:hypothetical protein